MLTRSQNFGVRTENNACSLVTVGMNPRSVRGSRTGVFIGCNPSDAFTAWTADVERTTGYEFVGCFLSMFADRLSAFFDFKGLQCLMSS